MIKITVNGVEREVPAGQPLPEMLIHLGLENQPLIVEHNRIALLKSEWSSIFINDADELEFIRITAGG